MRSGSRYGTTWICRLLRPAAWSIGLFLLITGAWPSASWAQSDGYTFVLHGVPLDEALESFSSTTGVAVAYAPRLARDRQAYCVARDESVEAVLGCILQESGLDYYRLSSGTYVLTAPVETSPARGYLAGRVADRRTGAPISDAHVQLADASVGAVTNESGRFTLPPLLPGQYVVRISHVGYRPWQDTLRVAPDARTRTTAVLTAKPVPIKPVVIDGMQSRSRTASPGRTHVSADDPPVGWGGGTSHPLQPLNALSGVRVNDLTADVHLQGGSPGDHQVRLDGVPVHLPRTLLGLVGPFSPFAVDRITVEKAGFGAEDGSQMAGLINATHALSSEPRADIQVDPLSLNTRLQLPSAAFGTDDVAAMAAGRIGLWDVYAPSGLRTTLTDWSALDPFLLAAPTESHTALVADAAQSASSATSPRPRYADLHAAARLQLDPLRTLHASVYRGHRRLAGSAWADPEGLLSEAASLAPASATDDYRWANLLGQMRYDTVLGSHTLLQTQLRASRYRLRHAYTLIDSLHVRTDEERPRLAGSSHVPFRDGNHIRTATLDVSVDHATGQHQLHAGAELTRTESAFTLRGVRLASSYQFSSGAADQIDRSFAGAVTSDMPRIRHTASTWRGALFATDRIALGDRWTAHLGVRLTYPLAHGTVFAEPRMALRYDGLLPGEGTWSMRTAAGLYRQFTYQTDASVLNAGALLPSVRIWLPVDASVTPPRAYHLTHELLFEPHPRVRLQVEGYYKHQPHHLTLRYAPAGKDAQKNRLATQRDFLAPQRGYTYGGTLSTTWEGSHIDLQARYTYDQTVRRSPARFNGRAHPAPWTVPHRVELGLDWMPTPRWTASLRGQGLWGRRWGFRRAYYDYFGSGDAPLAPPFDLSQPGAHRLPPHYQLDASLAYTRGVGPVTFQARLEVLNLTGRANVADWRLTRTDDQWTRTPRPHYPRLPSVALRVGL